MGVPRPEQPAQQRSDRDPLPGRIVNGKYRVLDVLARGGMGKIYRAEQVPLGRAVALKVLRTKYADEVDDDPQFQKRFFLEASILSKLQHTNIVTLYDYGKIEDLEPDQYFMAMEYLRGDTLAKRIRNLGHLAPRDAIHVFRQMARGLREAHRLGVVHRDLKPSNVILVPEDDGIEVVKILDFGIGKIVSGDSQQELTAEGAFLGSPRYMAPEQINEGRVDARSDVYALGVMLYEALCGRVPFEGDTNINTMMAHCNLPLPWMRDRSPEVTVPEPLEMLARHCLEKEPAQRPQTMDAFLKELALREETLFGTAQPGYTSSDRHSVAAPTSSPSALDRTGPQPMTSAIDRPSVTPGSTQATLTRSQFPEQPTLAAPQERRRVVPIVVAVVTALGVFGVVLLAWNLMRARPNSTTAAAAPAASTYTLTIESRPARAEVYDGERLLGMTPLDVPIDRVAVRTQPRHFVLKVPGYEAYTFQQGDSPVDTKVVAVLIQQLAPPPSSASAAEAAATAAETTPRATGPVRRGGGTTTSTPTTTPPATTTATATAPATTPTTDIKLKR